MITLARDSGRTSAIKPRILLVEDDIPVGNMVEEYLADLRGTSEVVRAYNAAEALDLLDHYSFDLVFTDVIMPGSMNGVEMARIVRTYYPLLPIIIATGNAPKDCLKESEAFPVLQKPYRMSVFLQKCAELGIYL